MRNTFFKMRNNVTIVLTHSHEEYDSMNQPIFILCGYGISQDIRADENYRTYLNIVFNMIFAQAAGLPATIIVCGGPTNGIPPYDVTEAQVMAEYLESLKARPDLQGQADLWSMYQEDQSLSSLENLVFAKRLMQQKGLQGPITIFCEATRERRMQETAQTVLGNANVEAIDFDVSKNRYLDPAVTQHREDLARTEALWTLEDESRLTAHHRFFEKKFEWFREQEAAGVPHVDVVQKWYKTKLLKLTRELMPDHPLLRD